MQVLNALEREYLKIYACLKANPGKFKIRRQEQNPSASRVCVDIVVSARFLPAVMFISGPTSSRVWNVGRAWSMQATRLTMSVFLEKNYIYLKYFDIATICAI